ncbi:hypothetical protein QNI16_00750 [Cytophagaceae bacterium YF14B1]|uniref:Lipoprotein n=1 Tax=Xanthocytophaga flava TaxID=3048013 RepID=A0AAE3QLK7_9BACT|nr:hypothetical protein [Xanthocytophaga flavus]MDJ1478989.1 hypothetical protein [Xanthocytophaga flavus]
MIRSLSFLFFTSVVIVSCSRPVYQEEFSIVNKTNTVTLFEIDPFPVELNKQSTSERYIENYRIKESIEVADSSRHTLLKAMVAPDNYIPDNSRGCEFFPRFAIKFGEKMVTLISTRPCPKIEYHITGKDQIKIVDLIDNSTIEKSLIYHIGN